MNQRNEKILTELLDPNSGYNRAIHEATLKGRTIIDNKESLTSRVVKFGLGTIGVLTLTALFAFDYKPFSEGGLESATNQVESYVQDGRGYLDKLLFPK